MTRMFCHECGGRENLGTSLCPGRSRLVRLRGGWLQLWFPLFSETLLQCFPLWVTSARNSLKQVSTGHRSLLVWCWGWSWGSSSSSSFSSGSIFLLACGFNLEWLATIGLLRTGLVDERSFRSCWVAAVASGSSGFDRASASVGVSAGVRGSIDSVLPFLRWLWTTFLRQRRVVFLSSLSRAPLHLQRLRVDWGSSFQSLLTVVAVIVRASPRERGIRLRLGLAGVLLGA